MNRNELLNILKRKALLVDGGMGTEIYARGVFINRCYEALNLENPDLIESIHQSFVDAGAEIIETNTFGATRIKLALHGLGDQTVAINAAAVKIVKSVKANHTVYTAGSIGPTGLFSGDIAKIDLDEIKAVFAEQITALVEAGADLLFYETFHSLLEIELAIKAARVLYADIPIIASMTFPHKSETIFGKSVKAVAIKLTELDTDVIGFNCSTGPQGALDLLKEFKQYTNKPLVVMPNAGYPKSVDGRIMYVANSELFGTYATKYLEHGALVIGGCCGTTPEFIKQMQKALRQQFPAFSVANDNDNLPGAELFANKGLQPMPTAEKSKIGAMLGKKMIVSMEVLPPKSPDIAPTLATVNSYKEQVTCLNIPDGPRASARMAITTTSYLVEKATGLETITHYACRDRNILGIQSDFLAMEALGIRNVLAITGDPPKMGNYPNATAVFDVDAIGLVKILAGLNRGLDIVGNEIGMRTSFLIGVGANPSADNLNREIERLEAKVAAGAEFVMTQPIYEVSQFLNFLEKIKHLHLPIILGISPLTSFKNAEFQHNEIPGMQISEHILHMMKEAPDNAAARKIGTDMAVDLINAVKDKIAGVYFMAQGKWGRQVSLEVIEKTGILNN